LLCQGIIGIEAVKLLFGLLIEFVIPVIVHVPEHQHSVRIELLFDFLCNIFPVVVFVEVAVARPDRIILLSVRYRMPFDDIPQRIVNQPGCFSASCGGLSRIDFCLLFCHIIS